MIARIAEAMVARLQGLGLFREVGRSLRMSVLQKPSAAAVILAYDVETVDSPVVRELGWDIVMAVATQAQDDGTADDLIDAVRGAFLGAVVLDGGVMPAKVPRIGLEGFEANLVIYTVQVVMEVVPSVIDSQ